MINNQVCAVVAWFNPANDELNNLKNHLNSFKDVIVVDNSNVDNTELLKGMKSTCNIRYLPQFSNKGIAEALNIGCTLAADLKYQWVLTLDQDSTFEVGQIEHYFERVNAKRDDAKIGLFAASRREDYQEGRRTLVITSGNILSIEAWYKVGGFDNSLFIDEVDFDLCFKLQQHGYTIYQFKDVILTHNLGTNYHERMLFGTKVRVMNHSALRKYYILRNRLVIRERYPRHRALYSRAIKLFFWTTILFEKNKVKKLVAFFLAYIDFKKNRLGQCVHTILD